MKGFLMGFLLLGSMSAHAGSWEFYCSTKDNKISFNRYSFVELSPRKADGRGDITYLDSADQNQGGDVTVAKKGEKLVYEESSRSVSIEFKKVLKTKTLHLDRGAGAGGMDIESQAVINITGATYNKTAVTVICRTSTGWSGGISGDDGEVYLEEI